MIEFESVTIRVGRSVVISDFVARCEPGTIGVLDGMSVLARASIIGAIAGTQSYTGAIRLSNRARALSGGRSVYVGFAEATVVRELPAYENIRMLAGRRARRSTIDAVASRIIDPGLLGAPAGDLSPGQLKRLQVVAAALSGAANVAFDRVLDGTDAPRLDDLFAVLSPDAEQRAVLVTAPVSYPTEDRLSVTAVADR